MRRQADIAFFCDARAVHFKKWIEALTERGYLLDVFSPWQDPESQNRHQAYTTPKAPFPIPTSVKTFGKVVMRARNGRLIKNRLKPNPPKLVHAHFLLDSGWMAAQLDMHPFVVTVHGSDLLVHPGKSRIQKFVANQVLQRCDRVVIVSEHLREKLSHYRVPEHKIRQVPSFIETSRFFPNNRPPRDRVVIGSARNFEPVYDVATLLKAVPIIAEDHPNVEVHLAGDGTQKEHLEKLATELGVKNKVKFLGYLDQKQLADFFRKID
nr:glycosyltransferase family 4 protein [candidate division KSB1 bacterium]NIR71140.1 glycosyltransferase family 4 protein [candidate division KSB1 bacterium]NIS23270.1 glycosyltransferase family 4 protein [candidate division KSB1 bacterium]NIT70148.1 glycosyltransferase family 4 protein [candidate division KSB1 bacterium]NIU23800.1 glycosyltransferase family 4 protein [candidate division KSB1 bacterium]